MESFLFQQHHQPFLLDCVYNYINQNGDLSNISPCYTTYNNSSDATHDSSSSSLSTPQLSSEKKRKHSDHNSYLSTGQSKNVMVNKSKKKKQNDGMLKKEKEENKELSARRAKNEASNLGYIHVRARRGQATDSHSLAERVRRERISDRMKKLQDLVPGCDKVIGKALVLDEIINYVQSLQNQVEFLSMKLASANPIVYDFGGELEEEMGSISHSMPSVIQSNHIQTTSYEGARNSLQQAMYGQGPSTFPQDGGSILMQFGLNNTCYFE